METWYDDEEDILNIQILEKGYWKSVELKHGILVDLTKDGALMAITFFQASKIFTGDAKKALELVKLISQEA